MKHSTCLEVPLFLPVQVSIPHQSFFLPACPTHVLSHLQKNHLHRTKVKQRLPISHFALIASSFEVWIEGGLIFGIGKAMAQTNVQEWDMTKVAGVTTFHLLLFSSQFSHILLYSYKSHCLPSLTKS
jgi:hypothetical protein